MSQETPDVDDKPHKPADDTEMVYYSGSPMLRAEVGTLVMWWIGGVVLIAVPIVWVVLAKAGSGPPALAWLICIVLGMIAFVWPVLMQRTIRYRISNYRIDYERGLLSKNIDTLELWHVEDISFHQSLLDRILGAGTITILSHDDTSPKLVLRGVPNPRPLFETLKQRVISVKRQRGVLKMDIGN
ncbi:hypothetical protein BH10PLA1_BH10PLA1_00640 [soil metagenome]